MRRCTRCQEILGGSEPIVVLDRGGPRETSLATETIEPSGGCYHTTCFQIIRAPRALDELHGR
jgi:hypothetical protein